MFISAIKNSSHKLDPQLTNNLFEKKRKKKLTKFPMRFLIVSKQTAPY